MKTKTLFVALTLLTLGAGRASAWLPEDTDCFANHCPGKAALSALNQAAQSAPNLTVSPEFLKSAADVQMAPVTGSPAAAAPAVVLPAAEEPDSAYHGGTVKHDAAVGHDIGVKTVRYTGSILKLPFAAVGGIVGGIIGATRSIFAKDDDDHNNNVGAGFMLGASALGHYAGIVIEKLLIIPALVVGAVGSVVGGIVGFFRGLFKKSEDK